MNCVLTRNLFALYGIRSTLTQEDGTPIDVTLEHSYVQPDKSFLPKIPVGTYECVRGVHCLSNGVPFSTFEVMKVPDFDGSPVSGILFHKGNVNADSHGCILLGSEFNSLGIGESRIAFEKFMDLQNDCDSFLLVVQ